MRFKNVLITGGAGFVGSNFALKLKSKYPDVNIAVMDNLKRRGSELNLPRLKVAGVSFVHGDIRNPEDFEGFGEIDLIIECSAEPSVMAGINSSPNYLIRTNLDGTINCLELARRKKAAFLFISTSRVYPIETLNKLDYVEEESRFWLSSNQSVRGASGLGVDEDFPLTGARSLYGATKLSSEMLLEEYSYNYGLRGIVNRCGVITGPWQMGKVDQGVIVLWVAKHIFGGKLAYIGFGGEGKQVRDFIHIDDLFDLIDIQINNFDSYCGTVYNVGGGVENSVSLKQLTAVCERITGNRIVIDSVYETRQADLRIYITNAEKIKKVTGWKPRKNIELTVADIKKWIDENQKLLQPILS